MEPDDYKFDLSTLNSIINGGATTSSAIRKRNRIGEDGDSLSLKRQNTYSGESSMLRSISSSPQLVGGINDQLFALSNLANDKQNEDEESDSRLISTKNTFSGTINNNDNNQDRSPSRESDASQKGSSQNLCLVSAQQRSNLSANSSASNLVANNVDNQQQLNHQQLLMAARTAALLSSSTSSEVGESQLSSMPAKNISTFVLLL